MIYLGPSHNFAHDDKLARRGHERLVEIDVRVTSYSANFVKKYGFAVIVKNIA